MSAGGWRDGVKPVTAKGLAPREAPNAKPDTSHRPMCVHSLGHVVRAGRMEAATTSK